MFLKHSTVLYLCYSNEVPILELKSMHFFLQETYTPIHAHTHTSIYILIGYICMLCVKGSEVKVKSVSPVRLSDHMNCSLQGSSVRGIFQVRILEWAAISFSRGSSRPRGRTPALPHCRQTLYHLSHQRSHYMYIYINLVSCPQTNIYICLYNWCIYI